MSRYDASTGREGRAGVQRPAFRKEAIMADKTFKAAIFKGIGDVEIADLPYPECGDDDVIVKNLIAGVCGSDVSAFNEGGDANMIWAGSEFGHEMVSEVVEVGKNVKDIALGDRVFPNMGQAKRDRMRMATVGGFSEYIHIPSFEINYSAIKIDNSIPLDVAVLLEPFVVGTRGAKATNPGPGKGTVVFGAGIIGMSAAIMLKWYGCEKVMVVDTSEYRLGNAERMGLIPCDPKEDDVKAKAIAEFGSTRGYTGEVCLADCYVDALAVDAGLGYFSAIAGRNAALSVVGVHHHPVEFNFLALCYNNWHISGCGEGSYEELSGDVMDMMKSGRFDLTALISNRFRQDDIAEALKAASAPGGAQKVVIEY
jgi:threonine dehydrogenase-like Zn-dependent dehydrogenase